MSRALLAFNPEAHSDDGNILLFGVSVPRPMRGSGLSALEELNLASYFLEARTGPAMASLLEYLVHRSSGTAIPSPVAAPLLQRLTRAAAIVHDALRSDAAEGSPLSAEGIFGSELEGLSPEDQEFETARRFVQFAGELSRAAAYRGRGGRAGPHTSFPERMAARRFAPGLSRALDQPTTGFQSRGHSWRGR